MKVEQLVGTWQIDHLLYYLFGAAVVASITRLIVALFRTVAVCAQDRGAWSRARARGIARPAPAHSRTFLSAYVHAVIGVDPDPTRGDYWAPWMLGFLEAIVYPVLMYTDNWLIIGGWIALKTLAQWDKWKTDRTIFNRFLIGNALVIIGAFVLQGKFLREPSNMSVWRAFLDCLNQ